MIDGRHIKGGIHCEFEDCFAESNMNCTLLRASYKGKEECPFYKAEEKNRKTWADIEAKKYAEKRIAELTEEIKRYEEFEKEYEILKKRVFHETKQKKAKLRRMLDEASRQKKIIEKRMERRINNADDHENNNIPECD